MNIYLVRHATALKSLEDPKEALSPQGMKEAELTAKMIAGDCEKIEAIISSPKERAIKQHRSLRMPFLSMMTKLLP